MSASGTKRTFAASGVTSATDPKQQWIMSLERDSSEPTVQGTNGAHRNGTKQDDHYLSGARAVTKSAALDFEPGWRLEPET
jgi:hypothetical protein